MPANILLVEDEPAIQELIAFNLVQAGHHVLRASTAEVALTLVKNALPDLILLDWMLPGASGVEIARKLRADERTRQIPIIMLTARSEEQDKVQGLEAGADDYITKPFSPRELLARIKAVMRRTQADNQPAAETLTRDLRFDRWLLDVNRRELVDEDGVGLSLSTAEFDLLKVFLERPQRVLSRDQLLDLARGREAVAFDRAIDTLVSRLRRKLERDPKNPELIKTIWGGGYMFSADVTQV